MRPLVDTHVLLWLFGAGGDVDGCPSPAQRAAVEAPENEVLISIATFWEVTLKTRVRKLRIDPARLEQTPTRLNHLVGVICSRKIMSRAAYLRSDGAHARSIRSEAALTQRCDDAGFLRLPILDPHLTVLATLPFYKGHRDPFDHLLIAQAIAENLILLTADRHAARYPVGLLAGQA